jgi:acetyl esterase/lipase
MGETPQVESSGRPPVPTSISAPAREYLATSAPYGDEAPPDDLSDVEGWLRYIETRDRVIAERLGQFMPSDLPVAQSEFQVDDVTIYVIRPNHVPDSPHAPIYLDIHGGALILAGGELCRLMATGGALSRDLISWAVDYRMPPLWRFRWDDARGHGISDRSPALSEPSPPALIGPHVLPVKLNVRVAWRG